MKIAILLILLLAAVEGGVQFWRHRELPVSTSPVLSWKNAELVTEASPPFGSALKIYQADRGMEKFSPLPNGGKIQIFYFEWDDLEAGPFNLLGGHESEICNLTAGFTVLETGIPRFQPIPGASPLEFHYTRLVDPAGRPVHAYKMPWLQGLGAWQIDSSRDHSLRLNRSFIRHRGSARVLQFGVFGVADEREAWKIVQRELEENLEWHSPTP